MKFFKQGLSWILYKTSSAPSEYSAQIQRFMERTLLQFFLRLPVKSTGIWGWIWRSAPVKVVAAVVERLKQEADRHWHIDPNRSLEFAERLILIGSARNDTSQIALGLMARGDALRFLNQMKEAWDSLEQAGSMFWSAGDEVGWARTRIGRLDLGMKLKRVADTLDDAERARAIFIRYGEREKHLRLDLQTGIVYNYLGDQHQAVQLLQSALAIAETLGDAGRKYFGQLYLNMGFSYDTLSDFRQALTYYDRARPYMIDANETGNIALLDINIAYIAQAKGNYRRSLDMLHDVLARVSERFPEEEMWAKCDMVECYLYLNRYAEARDLARQIIPKYRASNAYELARTLLHLAAAEAQLSNYSAAQAALEEAKLIFASQGATQWVVTADLWHGRVALKQGNFTAAHQEAVTAAARFESGGQKVNQAKATLLQGQALFALGDLEAAEKAGTCTLGIARHDGLPSLRYSTHFLLGQIAEAQENNLRAMRHYQAAAAIVERVQRGLSITLRPGFLEDKGEALRALIRLYIQSGQVGNAFETLERAKSQILLGYLVNRELLHWAQDDDRGRELVEKFNRLRAEHKLFNRLLHDPPRNADQSTPISPDRALAEIVARERQIRSTVEQLYLHNGRDRRAIPAPTISLNDVQRALNEDTLLIEYYNDGDQLWAFTLDEQGIKIHCLPVTVGALNHLLALLQNHLTAALQVDPQSVIARRLTSSMQGVLQRLHSALIEPLALPRFGRQRLVIVPYGALHYLPFHLLYDGLSYLIEQHEVVILPAGGLATRSGPQRKPGALILAHSREGQLPYTLAEAQMVQRLFGGTLHAEEKACRSVLQATPTQILHLAAHGQHRLDQPDLSYLQLADGQLYADDLLQQDLSYELVTLSGCETGRFNVTAGDELIGLGRGFLYSGSGALMVSLWPIVDDSTVHFMEQMYKALQAGASKAAALREAQLATLAENRELHPAFWGAFQLIGDACPLST